EAFAAAKKNTLVLLGIGVGGLLVTLLGVWIFLDRSVVSPIVRLAGRTEEISLGKNLNDKVSEAAGGEISILAGSIERLRISLVKILKRNAQS
ncbi:HAMP domain-containing protein, partial [bacterium]